MGKNSSHGRKRKRREKPSPLDISTFDQTTFPLLLSALLGTQNSTHAHSLLNGLLRSLLLLLPLSPLPPSLLSLFPPLLNSTCVSVSALALDAVGAASLSSLESNAAIASDADTVSAMVRALGSGTRRVARAACNAIMDLSTSAAGREALTRSGAVPKLLCCSSGKHGGGCRTEWREKLKEIHLTPSEVVSVYCSSVCVQNMEKETTKHLLKESKVDNFQTLVLDAAVNLINTSTEDFSDVIPEELFKRLLPLLKELLSNTRCSTISSQCRLGQHFLQSTKSDRAAAIFRLSMNRSFTNWPPDVVRLSIFGHPESEFMNFALSYWEDSPFLISAKSNNFEDTTIFNSLIHSFDPTTTETILNSVLQGLISCPPIASDELDIFSFLDEVKGVLGSPIVYGQDIRVVRTPKLDSSLVQNDKNKELHFFHDSMNPKVIDVCDVKKCKEAFEDGYTVAIRGMEFRFAKIAAIADALAILFGQPSVGANIYITPYRSQGLARHFDDHCVFVYQLYGQKQWRISPSSAPLLPRLYEPLCTLPTVEGASRGDIQYLLKEGDILYIPRGCFHEAHTMIIENEHDAIDNDDKSQDELSANFSLHVTFGIEVEPPFEWEGFTHIALHCWNQNQKRASINRRSVFVNLLHYAIRVLANRDRIFRKACMVAALPSSDSLYSYNRATFSYIVDYIHANAEFTEAFESIKVVVQEKSDDSLQWMRWLQHLPHKGEEMEIVDFNNMLGAFEKVVTFCSNRMAEAAVEFSSTKSEFCKDGIFDDACRSFQLLLEKYRKVRRQYMNGMLSLHFAA